MATPGRTRVPLAHTIATRDSTLQKDALCWNAHPTPSADGATYAERRFGVSVNTRLTAGLALGLFAFGSNLLQIVGTTFYVNGTVVATVDGTSRYQFSLIAQGGTSVFMKNDAIGYVWNGTTLTPVANANSGNTVSSVSMTAEGTGYTSAPVVGFTGGGGTGATGTANVSGGEVVSVTINNPGTGYTSAPTVTFTGGGGTGAAGTAILLPNYYPAITVQGVVYLDGYVFVLDPEGRIWNSNLNTPLAGNPLNFLSGSLQADPGVYITRLYNYVASMCSFSTTFFYDAGNTPPGTPLLPNLSAVVNVGCACDSSVVTTENTMFWIGQTRQKGRSVYIMNGLTPQKISDQFIDKVLNEDPLASATVYAFFIKLNGHAFYVLTLTASNLTLVFDTLSSQWHRWSTTVVGTPQTATRATLNASTGQVQVYLPSHQLTNGDIVNISSSNTSTNYLGTVIVTVIDANNFTYTPGISGGTGGINSTVINTVAVNADPNTPPSSTVIGTLIVTPYLQNFFAQVMYAFANNLDYLLGLNDGIMYQIKEGVTDDNGAFIYTYMRTEALDFGSNTEKFFANAEVIADKIQDTAYIGYSDDDFQTFKPFRPINLGANRSKLERLATARRRAFVLLYFGGFACRFNELELQVMEGSQ